MKFIIVATLLLTLTSLTLQNSWDKYLLNINLTNEPIKEEWVTTCVTGFKDCAYKGESSEWCAGAYRFKIVNNVFTPLRGGTGNIRSYRIPKGYQVNYSGKFYKSMVAGSTDPIVISQTKNLQDGTLRDSAENTSDQICPTMHPYWGLDLTVLESKYVQITKLMPEFLAALMKVQGSRYQKGEYGRKVNSCRAEADGLSGEITTLETSIITLIQQKTEFESTLTVLRERVTQYTRIINGSITAEQWIGNMNKHKEANAKLEKEISEMEKQLSVLRKKITEINVIITAALKRKTTLQTEITTLKTHVAETDTVIVTDQAGIRNAETIQATLAKYYGDLVLETKNVAAEKHDITEKMKLLKIRLDELSSTLETNNGKIIKIQDKMGKNQEVQKKLNKKLGESKTKKTTLLESIKTNEQSIREINISVNINNTKIVTLSTEVGSIESLISNKKAEIQKNTNYATSQTREHYVSLVTKTEKQITTVTTSLTEINTKISVSQTSASTKKNTKSEKQNCVTTNETRKTEFKVASAGQGNDVEAIFNKIKAIHDLGLAPLRETIDMVDENTAVLAWIVKAKTNMHTYLDNLPENPDVQKEGLEEFNRRRRRRMRRRRMI